MPKKVDHDERRRLIADALMRVAAEQGLEAVSLRHVAAAAGVSAGMVQHYFRTKDEMMSFALSAVSERSEARVRVAVGALGADPPPRALLRTMIAALLPLDDAAREDGRVALAFLAYTAVRPAASAELHPSTAEFVHFIARQLPSGEIRQATGLLALMEGLGVYLLGGQYEAEQALDALDAHLDLLFGAPAPDRTAKPGWEFRTGLASSNTPSIELADEPDRVERR
ncbi:TetR family transcriptional regulator C-terminal domain-containing protein [Actinoplanes sp. TRM 88003]|uniref:TetR family transcriptional regulator C-terminal domain-containing protein n=1 Tax=Paractinoplanes aksuensis TaxID=2939490 RepID=A0ABT1DGI4_9ACTN|nr:TetR family transcriptional regulator C-terminal domain-containing protein [Actinoplanes aksuensis]MCO8269945.1 TetR family transcriptional regulator C-terminal domain-containing protein [Actinoplanes aksuensis]